MTVDWLWDRNIPLKEIEEILNNERHPRFPEISALLLSRKNAPRDVFSQYLDKKIFVVNWPRIKRKMRTNKWNDPRIVFWQAVYEKLLAMFREKGIAIRQAKGNGQADELCQHVGEQIKFLRQKDGLTQKDLAGKLHISQQVISRIEKGGNISLLTIEKIAGVLNNKVVVDFKHS